ncbi:MAG: amidohydrolase family protein [Planctomycetota bacterium]
MGNLESLQDHIQGLEIIDTHEHLPFERDRLGHTDVLEEWLFHYFNCDLISAGISDADLATVRDSSQDLMERWALVEPYWHAAENTGYGRSLALAAEGVYGIEAINAQTLPELAERHRVAREAGSHYQTVLKEKSRIAVAIRDSAAAPYEETEDPFVFTIRCDHFIAPTHYSDMRRAGDALGMEIHTLDDWTQACRRYIETHIDGTKRVVCLKCGLAYHRRLRFDKVTKAEAEAAFNQFFADGNLPEWRLSIKAATALQDYMMHFVCQIADEHGLVYQIHTGLQEGHGNVIDDSNPVLLTNLFLEYRHVKFDIFHMGYPYMMELSNLAKNFRNVFIDMCWGHIISPEAARRALVEWLDAVPANKISAFGGDYCFIDGVYGHQELARRNVAASLAQKVDDGSISLTRARELAEWVFYENPKRLFGLDRFLD